MMVEARKSLVWGTAAAAVVSAALLASSGGGSRIAGLGIDPARAQPVATARVAPAAPALEDSASAAHAASAH